jgi:hypothetical protein
MLGTNWKTTLSGIGTILAALGTAAHGFSVGNMAEVYGSIPLIVTGIGLIVAKDSDVTGGTVPQTQEAIVRVVSPEVITEAAPIPVSRPMPKLR